MVPFTETNKHKGKRKASGREHRGKLMKRTQQADWVFMPTQETDSNRQGNTDT